MIITEWSRRTAATEEDLRESCRARRGRAWKDGEELGKSNSKVQEGTASHSSFEILPFAKAPDCSQAANAREAREARQVAKPFHFLVTREGNDCSIGNRTPPQLSAVRHRHHHHTAESRRAETISRHHLVRDAHFAVLHPT